MLAAIRILGNIVQTGDNNPEKTDIKNYVDIEVSEMEAKRIVEFLTTCIKKG